MIRKQYLRSKNVNDNLLDYYFNKIAAQRDKYKNYIEICHNIYFHDILLEDEDEWNELLKNYYKEGYKVKVFE